MTQEERAARDTQWAAWVQAGWTPRQIAAVAGVTPNHVRRVLRRAGWRGALRSVSAAEAAQWRAWRQAGWRVAEIAAAAGRAVTVVQRHLGDPAEAHRGRPAGPVLTPAEQADVARLRWLFAHVRPGASVDAVLEALRAAGPWRELIDDLRTRVRLTGAR